MTALGLWGLFTAVGVLASLALHVHRRRRVAREFGDAGLLARLIGEDLRRVPGLRVTTVALAATMLAVALHDPRWGAAETQRVETGTVVFVLDASTSMLARDLPPSRLERERTVARELTRRLPGASIGIVVFAGRAYAVSPPTVDPGAVDMYLDALHPGMVTQSGSSLAAALRQGLALLLGSGRAGAGALVLITDGDTEEDPAALREAIDLARRGGVRVFVLGAGTTEGAPVPAMDPASGELRGHLRGPDGDPVMSRLRESLLREIAGETGGLYRRLARAGAPAEIAAAVREGGGGPGGSGPAGDEAPPRYGWFAAAAFLLLCLEMAFGGGRVRGTRALLLLFLSASGCASPEPAGELFRAGRYAEAARAYRQALGEQPGSPVVHYNLGATALRLGEYEAARAHLRIATRTGVRRTRQWAYYNLGNSDLEPAFRQRTDTRAEDLGRAIVAYKRALLIAPADGDAKWNLELARRLLEEERRSPAPRPTASGGGGAGGGGGESDAAPSGGSPRPHPADRPAAAPELSRAEAERVLREAEEREVGIQREKLRKPQPPVVSH